MKTLDNGLSRAEFEYLYDTDNEEPETDKSPEYEALEWLKEVYYAVSYTHQMCIRDRPSILLSASTPANMACGSTPAPAAFPESRAAWI